ncbi:hypothetical protein N5853_06900 [Bartonella sp. HY329]|uniref:hypothetical protein n=1 Tax=unclassified Bartonella TaxID=2645622 RepID=UPI0021C87B0D|nr:MULTISPECIES: hypothetical protein [unclassified Bartonella]UXM93866.1 hypothetical protein N5853_06900 [Bartonella sp. HY329]UXN08187.1 hypothetical protein N5852_06910 [Bartonella sp. HY328]
MLKSINQSILALGLAFILASAPLQNAFSKIEQPDFRGVIDKNIPDPESAFGPFDDDASKGDLFAHPLPVVLYDQTALPAIVGDMRLKIINAAKTGEIEALRPLLGTGDNETQLRLTDEGGDPIEFLKEISGDGEGLEILSIIIDLLNSGYVHLDQGTDQEIYVWPYLFAYPIDKLTKAQMVETFQIMTAGDFEAMKDIGAYSFFRIGITPDGKWQFFVSGD